MTPTFDERDEGIRAERLDAWNERTGPRVGDFVKMPDGSIRRFTYDWGDDIQTTTHGTNGSFYFDRGYLSYSGSLDRAIDKDKLRDTGESKDGRAWFFHHDSARAHNGVDCSIPCRVYRYQP